ncbi:T9SS type A sorting domain-containing protein [Aureivirga sp. CE67]|uniref:T9SS type A sorting domain-containing protein n=1 Tax=Aureivirga sp. CE67 TaxID=1788983 RepID=UPI0018CBF156|nr:T9SS type A sorting domain-containing protein [Aureivirga sp. CE67]
MKKILLLIMFLTNIQLFSQDCNCDHTISNLSSTNFNVVNASSYQYEPGDVFCIPAGDYQGIRLIGFEGTEENPLTIKNCGGEVTFSDSIYPGIDIKNSKFLRFTGTGDENIEYGIHITSSPTSGLAVASFTTDIEIDHIEIENVGFAGIIAKTDPTCSDPDTWRLSGFILKNLDVHHNYIHDTHGEGIYIGYTGGYKVVSTKQCDNVDVFGHWLEDVSVHHNIFEDIGWDGIQLNLVRSNGKVYNNTIINHGAQQQIFQDFAMSIGGGKYEIYNNYIRNEVEGKGMQLISVQSGTKVYNNILINPKNDGIFIHCRDELEDVNEGYYILNNTIINPEKAGVRFFTAIQHSFNPDLVGTFQNTIPSYFINNAIINPGNEYEIGDTWKGVQENYLDFDIPETKLNMQPNILTNTLTKIINDVGFEDVTNHVYKVSSSNSILVDSGTNISSYGVNLDYDNIDRPQGNGYDIGAYEYNEMICDSPNNLEVVETYTNGFSVSFEEIGDFQLKIINISDNTVIETYEDTTLNFENGSFNFSSDNIFPNSAYKILVKNNCDGIFSDSVEITATTLNIICEVPEGTSVTNVTQNTAIINVNITAVDQIYELRVFNEDTGIQVHSDLTSGSNYDLGFTGVILSNTSYSVQVRFKCEGGTDSEWSEKVYFTTPNTICEIPSDISFSNITTSSGLINLNYDSSAIGYEYEIRKSDTNELIEEYILDTTNNYFIFPSNLNSLEPNTTYKIKIKRRCNETEVSEWSEFFEFTTMEIACSISEVILSNITSSSIDLTVFLPEMVDAYKLELRKFENDVLSDIIQQHTLSSSNYTLSGLEANTNYKLYVKSKCSETNFSNWEINDFTTLILCEVPTNLLVNEITHNSAKVNFESEESFSEYEFKLFLTDTNELIQEQYFETNLNNFNLPYNSEYLEPNTNYSIQIRKKCQPVGNNSSWTELYNFTTLTPPCDFPDVLLSNITYEGIDSEVTLAMYSNEYIIEVRKYDNGILSDIIQEHILSITTNTITGLEPETTYQLLFKSKCGDEYSNYLINNFTTKKACNIPSNIIITDITHNSAKVIINDVETAEMYEYVILEKESGTQVFNSIDEEGNTEFDLSTLGTLDFNTTYQLKLRKMCENGYWSDYTELFEFTTENYECPLPSDIEITDITHDSARLNLNIEEGDIFKYKLSKNNEVLELVDFTASSGYIDFNNLESNTYYKVQLKRVCVINEQETLSEFTNQYVFKTLDALGVNDEIKTEYTLFPNPVYDNLSIQSDDNIDHIKIFDIVGKLILNKKVKNKTINISTSDYSSGIYLLEMFNGNKKTSLKFIKK